VVVVSTSHEKAQRSSKRLTKANLQRLKHGFAMQLGIHHGAVKIYSLGTVLFL